MKKLLQIAIFLGLQSSALVLNAAPSTPNSDFIDNGDGTVTHKITGLSWKRCVEGLTWTGQNCSGTPATFNFTETAQISASFAGKSDWRLPTIAELAAIVERDVANPTINSSLFPNTPIGNTWSSTIPADPTKAGNFIWAMEFQFGTMSPQLKFLKNSVRLVRGRAALAAGQEFTPSSNFTDNNDGTVTDKTTGLSWKRCVEGQTWTGSNCSGEATFFEFDTPEDIVANATLLTNSTYGSHSDWRIPSENELVTLIEFNRFQPALNTALFPNAPNLAYSSSACPSNNTQECRYWDVSFNPEAGSQTRAMPFLGSGYRENDAVVPALDNTIRLVRGQRILQVGSTTNDSPSASFDAQSNLATLEDVQVGAAHFRAQLQLNPATGQLTLLPNYQQLGQQVYTQVAKFDVASGIVTIPQVVFNASVFKAELMIVDQTNFVFSVKSFGGF